MNGLLIFLLSTWISSAVSDVSIRGITRDYYITTYHKKLVLTCDVTGSDVFEGWKGPTGFVHNSSDYLYETIGTGDTEHHLTIHQVLMKDAGEWTCLAKSGKSRTFALEITGELVGTTATDQKLVEGLPGIININVVGSPYPTFVWKKDNVVIKIADRFSVGRNGSLLIAVVNAADEGTYNVDARQAPATIAVPAITVSVLVRPTFTSASSNQTRSIGEDLSIPCQATGKPDPKISWKKGDTVIQAGGRFVIDAAGYTIKKIQLSDIGAYTCVASNVAGTEEQVSRLSSIAVTVVDTPEKTQNLVSGKPGTVAVNVLGDPKPDFQWKKDGVDIVEGSGIQVANNGSLLIQNVQLSNAGMYELSATQNGLNKTVKDIVVKVLAAPTITSVSIEESRTVGGTIMFKCNATGSPVPTISWKKGTDDVTADARIQITAEGLTISNIMKGDVGEYTCVANNSVGVDTQISKLTSVLVPPKLSRVENQQIEKGKELKVNCNTTSGNPPPDVVWKKDGKLVAAERQTKYAGGNVLTIASVQPEDSGKYECFARNGAVNEQGDEIVRNTSMIVDITYPPVFDPSSTQTIAKFNAEVEMKCVAKGNPTPDISLSFNGKDVQGNMTKSMPQTVFIARVTLSKVADYGVYTCSASNVLKPDGVKHKITVTVPLQEPEIVNVNAGCDNATITWRQDTTGPITIKQFELTVYQGSKKTPIHTQLVDVDKSSFTVKRLQENTEYNVELKQQTKDLPGAGRAAKTTFTTITCELPKITYNEPVNGENTLTWPEAQEEIDMYILRYRLKEATGPWTNKTTDTIYVKLTDLEAGKEYVFQVYVKDTQGKVKPLTGILEKHIAEDSDEEAKKSTNPPDVVERKKGLSGGAIAAIVIVIILLVLIAVDIFCCFFNHCGVVHMCAATCSGQRKTKYKVDDENAEEGTKLKEIEGGKEAEA